MGPVYLRATDKWVRRVGIMLQLGWKERTDSQYLQTAILANQGDEDFFIQKAIGWALRDYSKVNPEWVRTFVANHALSALAQREGCKYLWRDLQIVPAIRSKRVANKKRWQIELSSCECSYYWNNMSRYRPTTLPNTETLFKIIGAIVSFSGCSR